MISKFRLVVDVVLDTEMAANVIQTARQHHKAEGSVDTVGENGAARTLSADEFINEIEDALMELAQRNPLLINANVEIERVACTSAAAVPEPGPLGLDDSESSDAGSRAEHEDPRDTSESEVDLEEFETGLYLCRWPNGEFSLVKADDRKDAVVQLDQWAGA